MKPLFVNTLMKHSSVLRLLLLSVVRHLVVKVRLGTGGGVSCTPADDILVIPAGHAGHRGDGGKCEHRLQVVVAATVINAAISNNWHRKAHWTRRGSDHFTLTAVIHGGDVVRRRTA